VENGYVFCSGEELLLRVNMKQFTCEEKTIETASIICKLITDQSLRTSGHDFPKRTCIYFN